MVNTCTVIGVNGGLLRTSTSCDGSSSSTLYVDCSNVTVIAIKSMIILHYKHTINNNNNDDEILVVSSNVCSVFPQV